MCILMATRDHPDYDLVLVSNRDEYFARKASPASWNEDDFILCPLDRGSDTLERTLGTWIGANRDGKIGTVLNLKLFDDPRARPSVCPESRGRIPIRFLSSRGVDFKEWDSYDNFCHQFPGLEATRDFNFFYGDCTTGDYRVIDSLGNSFEVLSEGESRCIVVSNDVFQVDTNKDQVWGKVALASQALRRLVRECKVSDEETFIEQCLNMASINALQSREDHGSCPAKAVDLTMETVFVPPMKVPAEDSIGTSVPIGEYYGTRSQTVILVSRDRSRMTYVERILHESDLDAFQYNSNHCKEQKRYDFDLAR